jgi:hypothetical protein
MEVPLAGATKKNKNPKAKDAARAQHEANRRFKLRHGIKRSKATSILAAEEKTDEQAGEST